MEKENVHKRMQKNANSYRYISRDKIFQMNRKMTAVEISYMRLYSLADQKAIKESIESPLPDTLPPLGPTTISIYRRKNQPIYKTRLIENG